MIKGKNMSLLKIYNYLFVLLCVVVPFEEKFKVVPNIIMIVLAVLFFFVAKQGMIRDLFSKLSFKLFCFLLMTVVFGALFRNQFQEDLFLIKKLMIPFVLIVLSIPIRNLFPISIAFISSTIMAVVISCFNIIRYVANSSEFQFSRGEFINDVLISERLYLGFCCVISFVLLIQFFYTFKKKSTRALIIFGALSLMIFVFIIAARIAIISFLVITVIHIFRKHKTKWIIVYGGLLVSIVVLFFMLNKNLSFRFLRNTDTHRNSFIEKIAVHEPRFDIWKCSYNIFKKDSNIFLGNGFATVRQQLLNCYVSTMDNGHRKDWFMRVNFNTHNQYIDILIGSGLLGFFLFIGTLFFLYFESAPSMLVFYLIIALLLMMMVENIFQRQIGGYLFSIIMLFVYQSQKNQGERIDFDLKTVK